MDPVKLRMRSELEGEEKDLFEISVNGAEKLTDALTNYVNSLDEEQKKHVLNKTSFFVYNTSLLYLMHELYYLNSTNTISLEDALTNIDVLTNSLKTMLTNIWPGVLDARNPNQAEH